MLGSRTVNIHLTKRESPFSAGVTDFDRWVCGLGAETRLCVIVARNSDQAKYRALQGFDTAIKHLVFLHRTVRLQLFVQNVASTFCLLLASSQRSQYI